MALNRAVRREPFRQRPPLATGSQKEENGLEQQPCRPLRRSACRRRSRKQRRNLPPGLVADKVLAAPEDRSSVAWNGGDGHESRLPARTLHCESGPAVRLPPPFESGSKLYPAHVRRRKSFG